MANLFKNRITRYVDIHGRRAKKDTPGAQRVREKSKKWYGEYKDAQGITRRAPLMTDKAASQAKLNELVRNEERRSVGLFDPYEEHRRRSVSDHITDYGAFLEAKDNSEQHVNQTISRIRRLAAGCKFERLSDIDAAKVAGWLLRQRKQSKRFSIQTSNFYLDSFKYLCNWLVRHERLAKNPVSLLQRLNVETDRRHDRRSLGDEEFERLLEVATNSDRRVEGVEGRDRAMLYILAAWTGYRRRELASLTLRSFELDAETPIVEVRAAYSKRRREDAVPLHDFVVEQLRVWLAEKPDLAPDDPIFDLRTPKGDLRRTSKMMKKDLSTARENWLEESPSEEERKERESSDFLRYENAKGEFADFHANRHTFITRLSRSGISLGMAQKLARHSDPRLTANRYTHLEIEETAAAISNIPHPTKSTAGMAKGSSREVARSDENPTDDDAEKCEPGSLVAGMVAGKNDLSGPALTSRVIDCPVEGEKRQTRNRFDSQHLHKKSPEKQGLSEARPRGFEPLTLGSEV